MNPGHSASDASRAPLSGLAPDWAAKLITATSEVALVVDRGGIIRHVEFSGTEAPVDGAEGWIGTPWVDTVTSESRGKIEQMLREATTSGTTRRRQVNHPSRAGADIPVAYNAVRAEDGSVIAAGRDVAREAQAVAVNLYREFLRGNSHLRVLSEPIGLGER